MPFSDGTIQKVVMSIDGYNGGWNEQFWINGATPGVPQLATARLLALGRRLFFGEGMQISRVRVSDAKDGKHDALVCQLPYPLGPHPLIQALPAGTAFDAIEGPQDLDACIQLRFENAAGKWAYRMTRGVPDVWIFKKALRAQYFPVFTAVSTDSAVVNWDDQPGGGPLGTWLDACHHWLAYVLNNTVKTTLNNNKLTAPDPSGNWLRCFAVGAGNRKTGRPSGLSRGRRPKNLVQ